jgi:hypothetical protein
MNNDQYLFYAADCHLMARMARDQHERRTGLDMAQSWLRLVQLPTRPSLSPFDRRPSFTALRRKSSRQRCVAVSRPGSFVVKLIYSLRRF